MKKLVFSLLIAMSFACSIDDSKLELQSSDPIQEAFNIVKNNIKGQNKEEISTSKVLCHSDFSQPSGTACVQHTDGTIIEVKWQTYLISASNMATEIGYSGTLVNACTSCGKASKEGDVDYQDIFDNPTNDPNIQEALETIGRLRRFQLEENRGGARVLCQTNYSLDFGSACVLTESGKLIKVKWTTSLYTPFLGGVTTYTGSIVQTCSC